MENSKLTQAIGEALTKEYMGYFPQNKTAHEFSIKFEKKMKKLIRRRKKPYYMMINTAGKRAACIAAIVTVAASAIMSVEAVRMVFVDFFVHIFEKFSIIQSQDTENDAPDTIEEVYGITYDLSGYSIDFEVYNDFRRNIKYKNGDKIIVYYQEIKSLYEINHNTENVDIQEIDIKGIQAIYYRDNHNYGNIVWDNGDYIISLSSNISKEQLILVAESVSKIEY